MDDENLGWHLDKRVPIALIISLIIHTSVGVWFIAQMSSSVDELRKDTARHEASIDLIRMSASARDVQLAKIEANTEATKATLDRLSRQVDGGGR